ncbi:MAG: gamma carbonic anhydrase family protein [Gammaproteobacteria bacterium]|nr:gamma carbonic anhydrase family protein [Gammaproteobacteria bacterium]
MLYSLGESDVRTLGRFYVAPGAVVIGQVTLGEDVSIWFNAVLRGDNDRIDIGAGSNVQECAVLHVDPGIPLCVGKRVTVGHKAMLHGCTVGDGSLIGMNAVVLNNAVIGKNCLIGANALVKEGAEIPDGSLVVGSPAKVVRQLDEAAIASMDAGTQNYIDKIALYSEQLTPKS